MSDSNHLGHRERVKKKLLEIGLDKFHEHEILEFLLFLEYLIRTPILSLII